MRTTSVSSVGSASSSSFGGYTPSIFAADMTVRDSVSIDAADGNTVASAAYCGLTGDCAGYRFTSAATSRSDRERHFNTMLLDVLHLERVPVSERQALVDQICTPGSALAAARDRFVNGGANAAVDIPVPPNPRLA